MLRPSTKFPNTGNGNVVDVVYVNCEVLLYVLLPLCPQHSHHVVIIRLPVTEAMM